MGMGQDGQGTLTCIGEAEASGLDHWLQEVSATDVVLYERWMNNEIMVPWWQPQRPGAGTSWGLRPARGGP